MATGKCFLCETTCEFQEICYGDKKIFNCPVCGSFGISRTAELNFRDNVQIKQKASIIAKEKTLARADRFILCDKTHGVKNGNNLIGIEDFISEYPKTLADKIDRSLLNLSRMVSDHSDRIKLTLESRTTLFSHDIDGMSYILKQLYDMGYIGNYIGTIPGSITIEAKGWNQIGKLSNTTPYTNVLPSIEAKTNTVLSLDFNKLKIRPELAQILSLRWEEAKKCIQAKAFLCSIIMMGSFLEGLLLAVLDNNPKAANESTSSPKDSKTGKPKLFREWSLNEMIEVAHTEKWIDLDIKKFSHSLREFRNLVHPQLQIDLKAYPDEHTSNICWQVVQAAAHDLAKVLS